MSNRAKLIRTLSAWRFQSSLSDPGAYWSSNFSMGGDEYVRQAKDQLRTTMAQAELMLREEQAQRFEEIGGERG